MYVDTVVLMDQPCIAIVTYIVTCHADVTISLTLNDLLCLSAMSIWYKHNIHTPRVSLGWVLATLFPVFIFPFHAISTECNFLQLSPPQQQVPRETCGTEVLLGLCVHRVCSAVMPAWHRARTSIFLLSISSLRVSPVSLHQQLLIVPSPRANTMFPSCIRHKPTFVL